MLEKDLIEIGIKEKTLSYLRFCFIFKIPGYSRISEALAKAYRIKVIYGTSLITNLRFVTMFTTAKIKSVFYQ